MSSKSNADKEQVFINTLEIIKTIQIEPSVRYRGLLLNSSSKSICNSLQVYIINADCIDTCIDIITKSKEKIGLLNMASEYSPGGGVKKGSVAQEEDICRRTSLYPTLSKHRYPLAPDELIFSPNVKILKSSSYQLYSSFYNIDGVVSSAAIRRPILTRSNEFRSNDKELLYNKIQMMLETFEYHNIQHLILGAWGCGAFRNPPKEVAIAFKNMLFSDRFKGSFTKVTFAIANNKNNYDEFMNVFRDSTI
jgi:uncharacterized protein (TIGR02452 family)